MFKFSFRYDFFYISFANMLYRRRLNREILICANVLAGKTRRGEMKAVKLSEETGKTHTAARDTSCGTSLAKTTI